MGSGFERIASVFAHARALDAALRTDYLDAACAADTALRAEVEALLEAHDAAPGPGEPDPLLPARPDLAAGLLERAAPADEAWPVVPGFRILRRLAEGGMGTVYVAEQAQPRRRVALKVLRPEGATAEGRRRFEREAEALARLEHPGIARVLLYGMTTESVAPRPFIAMDLVEGEPLTTAAGGMALDARVALLAEVAEAVAHAHAKGVIHRDLKPDNILVPASGKPKVVDFGVARLLDDDAVRQTRSGLVIGTLAYMSPEQARGDIETMDTRSDVYSLGVIGYEILTGHHPLGDDPGTFTQVVRRIIEETPPDPAAVDARLRGDLALILTKALTKVPEQRYASASALAEDLRRHLREEPILARPLTGAYQLRWFLRRHWKPVVVATVGLALLVAGLVGALALARSERRQRLRADRSAAAMRRALVQQRLQAAASALREHETRAAVEALERIPPGDRGWEWAYLVADADDSIDHVPLDLGPLKDARLGGRSAASLVQLPDRTVLVLPRGGGTPPILAPSEHVGQAVLTRLDDRPVRVSRWGGTLHVHDTEGREVCTAPLRSPRGLVLAAGSEDGSLLAVVHDGALSWSPLEVFDVRTGTVLLRSVAGLVGTDALLLDGKGQRVFDGGWSTVIRGQDLDPARPGAYSLHAHAREVTALALSPDGQRLASGSADQTVRVWDPVARKPVLRIDDDHGGIEALVFSPDGRRLISGTDRGALSVWDATDGRRLRRLHGHRGPIHDLRFAGETLESLGDDGLRRWRVDGSPEVLTHHRQPVAKRPTSYVYGVAFSPDGRRLATAAWDGRVCVVDLATCAVERSLELEGEYLRDVAWSPDGRFVVSGHDRLVRWNVETGQAEAVRAHEQGIECLAWLPDGERILTGDFRGALQLRDAASLEILASWRVGAGKIPELSIDAAGERVATIDQRGGIAVWSLPEGALQWQIRAHAGGTDGSIAFSTDGRLLASGGPDTLVRLWDAATGEAVATLEGHTDPVYALAWLPDDSRLFSGSSDGSVMIWNPRAGEEHLRLGSHADYVYRLAVSPDGATVASASGDNTVRLWTTRTWREREALRRSALAEDAATTWEEER